MITGGYKNVRTGIYQGVQVPVQSVSKQRYVDATQKKNRPGVSAQQLKSMAKKSRREGLIFVQEWSGPLLGEASSGRSGGLC